MPTTDSPAPSGAGWRATRRVLYVDYSIGFGGATKSLSLVAEALPHVEKFVMTCQEPELVRSWYSGMRVARFRRWANYRVYARASNRLRHVLGEGWVFILCRKSIAAVDLAISGWHCLRLMRLIRRHRIDCVHLNNGFAPLEGMLAARLTHVPCIVHMRGMAVAKKGADLYEARRVTHTIAVSRAVAETLRQTLGASEVTTIHDPVNLALFEAATGERAETRRELEFRPDDLVVAIFGRVVRWKGQLEFVRALSKAMAECPRLRGLIVGDESDGGPEYLEEVKAAIAASGFPGRFRMAGYRPQVAGLYHASDIVVHASIEPEPFGMVVPEAMAARRPVVATAAGGPCEVVTDGVDGVLVPPGDVEALARAVLDLARDPARRLAMGERGAEKARRSFGVEGIAQQVADVYERVLNRSPRTAGR